LKKTAIFLRGIKGTEAADEGNSRAKTIDRRRFDGEGFQEKGFLEKAFLCDSNDFCVVQIKKILLVKKNSLFIVGHNRHLSFGHTILKNLNIK
jgi:hypothetical protein